MYSAGAFIGKGILYIDVFTSIGQKTGELDVGNAIKFEIDAPKIEKKELISKRTESYGQTIATVPVKQTQGLKFTLTDIVRKNLALAMFGEDADVTVNAGSVTDETITAKSGKYVALANRMIKTTPAATVNAATDVGVQYVAGTGYEIDSQSGRLLTLPDGDIPDGRQLNVGYSYDGVTGYKVNANKVQMIQALLRFVGTNIATGKKVEVIIYKASIESSGGMEWLTDDFAKLEFTGDILLTPSGTWEVIVLD
jgi:hypothetical protein